MIRVLHICNNFWPNVGGTETFVLALAGHSLTAGGLAPAVLTLNRVQQVAGTLPDRAWVRGIPVRRIPYLQLRYYKPVLLPVSLLQRFDVLHVHGVGSLTDAAVATRRLHGRPIVVSTHGGIFHTPALGPLKRAYFFALQPRVLAGAARVVACSEPDLALFRRVRPDTTLIENGVDLSRARAARGVAAKVERRFLFVGRLIAGKRVDRLLHAFARLRDRGVDAELRVVGDDAEGRRAGLERLARDLGLGPDRVTFAGAVSDDELAAEYAAAGWTVSASEYEGFGLAVVEAMGAGCVPVLNDIPAFRPFVAGGGGRLVDFADAEGAAAAIADVLAAPVEPLRRLAVERVEGLSWDRKILEWRDLYEAVVAERNGGVGDKSSPPRYSPVGQGHPATAARR